MNHKFSNTRFAAPVSLGLLVCVALSLLSSVAAAHTRFRPLSAGNSLSPRSPSDGLKVGPCGGIPRGSQPTVFSPGQTITVKWEETIDHPGRYEFNFSPSGDANWVPLKTVTDTQNQPISGQNYHQYETTLTLPSTPCQNCTIQLIQVMTENPQNPEFYFSCTDIQIAGTPVGPGPSPSPTPPCP